MWGEVACVRESVMKLPYPVKLCWRSISLRGYWGRGLATEAGHAFVQFGFDELGLHRIAATIDASNDASAHILEGLGFLRTRTELGVRSFAHYESARVDRVTGSA